MENKRLSVYKALRESAQNVFDNFAPFVFAFIKTAAFTVLTIITVGVIFALLGKASLLPELQQLSNLVKGVSESGVRLTSESYQSIAMSALQFMLNNFVPFLLAAIIGALAMGLISLAYTRFSLNLTDKKSSEFSILSSENLKLMPVYYVASALFCLMIGAGLLALFIPGVYLYLRFGFYNYFIVDQNVGAVESLKRSWRSTAGYGWDLLVLYIIYWCMPNLGFLGLILTASIGILMIASAYRQLNVSVKPAQPVKDFIA
jgi:hypothetical protein